MSRRTQEPYYKNQSSYYQGAAPQQFGSYPVQPSTSFIQSRLGQTTPRQAYQQSNKRTVMNIDSKKRQINSKLKDVVSLYQNSHLSIYKDLSHIHEAERDILGNIQNTEFQQRKHVQNQPNRSQTNIHNTIDQSQYPKFTTSNFQEKPLISQTYRTKQAQQNNSNHSNALKSKIQSVLRQNKHVQLSADALQIIRQIQRIAVDHIQKVVEQKNNILSQLNSQIRLNNNQKTRIIQLEKQSQYIKANGNRNFSLGPVLPQQNSSNGDLKSQNQYLKRLLSQKYDGIQDILPGLFQVFQQAQNLRQQTLRLLKFKESRESNNDQQNRRLKAEVQRLQTKIQYLERQKGARFSKPSYEVINQEQYSPISANNRKQPSYRNSAADYESIMADFKRIAN